MSRYIVGITGDIESMRMAYAGAVRKAGAHPVLLLPIPEKDKIKKISRVIDALLIPGGRDVDPAFYRGKMDRSVKPVSAGRFYFEKTLLKEIMKLKKPVLGVCYGMQFLNVICGGTLYIDLPGRKSNPVNPVRKLGLGFKPHPSYLSKRRGFLSNGINHKAGHIIELYNRTKLYYILGIRELAVNSTHHQGIKKLGKGLTASACSQDNLIEAIELRNYPFFIGVQWHPERLSDKHSRILFKSFVSSIIVKGVK